MKETDLYNIDCNDIEDILAKNNENNVVVTVKNDQKYRDLRKIILHQKKKIDEQASQIKILEELISKENNIDLNKNDDNIIMKFFNK